MTCPACGYPTASPADACRICGWEEGGPDDFGFVELGDRPFCPEPPDYFASMIERLAAAFDIDPAALTAPWPLEEIA